MALVQSFEPFDNQKETFKNYKMRFENYIRMKNIEKNVSHCATLLLNSIGSKQFQLVAAEASPKDVKELEYQSILDILEKHLAPKQNTLVTQHKFLSCFQSENQSITEYVTTLRTAIMECEFYCECKKSINGQFLRAQFIRGIKSNNIRKKLLQMKMEETDQFNEIVSKAIALEAAIVDSKQMSHNQETPEINKIKYSNSKNKNEKKVFKSNYSDNVKNINFKKMGLQGMCLRCGKNNHGAKECRIDKNKLKCNSCHKKGHIEKGCITSKIKNNRNGYSKENANYQIVEYGIYANTSSEATSRYYANVDIQGKKVKFEIDTGSGFTFMPKDIFLKLKLKVPIIDTNIVFKSFTREMFKPIGKIKVIARYQNKEISDEIFIMPRGHTTLLGRSWIKKLDISINESGRKTETNSICQVETRREIGDIMKQFESIFQPIIGCTKQFTISLQLRENARPIFTKHPDIPYALLEKVDKELADLEERGVITKTNCSNWGSPLVVIPKTDGNIRLCVDYKVGVNERLVDAHNPIRKIYDILNYLRNSKYFCVLDLYKAYLHIPVDEESSVIQTIATHRGTYKMNRLSFGIKSGPSEFNRIMGQILCNIPKTEYYFDDIIVHGQTKEECITNLELCFEQLKKFDLHLNENKCSFFKIEIEFLGHTISHNQIAKSAKKVEAITGMPIPKSNNEVRRFLGMVTYYAKFIPKVSSITAPLRKLIQKDVKFHWSSQCNIAFSKLKNEIASDRVLTPFNPSIPVRLACDAGPEGIAGVLSHVTGGEERPIAFASRSLTSSEKNYSQIDKEALAIVFAVGHFHQYLFGRKFELVTDNKPLVRIFHQNSKIPPMTAARLQRYAAYLSGFNYSVIYIKGVKNINADCISRAPTNSTYSFSPEVGINDEVNIICNESIMQISNIPLNYNSLKIEKEKDPEITKIIKELQSNSKDETIFVINNGILFKGSRVVIPESLKGNVLLELHKTHVGITKMKQLARRYVYWPKIDNDIEKIVRSCEACAMVKTSPPKAPVHSWEEPSRNWQRIHMDYAGPYLNYHYFVVIDAKSKWAEIGVCRTAPSSVSTIEMLNDMFARHGYPDVLVSDNATIFQSEIFKKFCDDRYIYQKFIAPGHPATNGLAERHIRTLKHRLASMINEHTPIREKVRKILFKYRATPLQDGKTPSEKYLNRQIRIQLETLKPIEVKFHDNYKCSARQLSVGERVMARYYETNKQTWKFGIITEKLGHLHYIIKLDNGYKFKRHINQLRQTSVQNQSIPKHDAFKNPITSEARIMTQNLPDECILENPIPEESMLEAPVPNESIPEVATPGAVNQEEVISDHSAVEYSNQPIARSSGRARKPPSYLNDYGK